MFSFGVELALWVTKQRESVERVGFVDFLFSLVGLMSVFLVTTGIRALKNRLKEQDTTESTFSRKAVHFALWAIVLCVSFGIKQSHNPSLTTRGWSLTIALFLMLLLNNFRLLSHLWKILATLCISLTIFVLAT